METFKDLDFWLKELTFKSDNQVLIYLVGNKSDIQEREVDSKLAKSYAEKKGLVYKECSAKTGEGVDEVRDCV